jgi:hypothetical protein
VIMSGRMQPFPVSVGHLGNDLEESGFCEAFVGMTDLLTNSIRRGRKILPYWIF